MNMKGSFKGAICGDLGVRGWGCRAWGSGFRFRVERLWRSGVKGLRMFKVYFFLIEVKSRGLELVALRVWDFGLRGKELCSDKKEIMRGALHKRYA